VFGGARVGMGCMNLVTAISKYMRGTGNLNDGRTYNDIKYTN